MKPQARSSRYLDEDNKPIHGKVITHIYHILFRKDFSEIEARVRYWEWGWQWELHGQVTSAPVFPVATLPPQGPGCCLWEACSVPLSSLLSPLPPRQSLESARVRSLGNPRLRNLLASYYANIEVQPFLKNRPFLGPAFATSTASNYARTFCYHELPAIY